MDRRFPGGHGMVRFDGPSEVHRWRLAEHILRGVKPHSAPAGGGHA